MHHLSFVPPPILSVANIDCRDQSLPTLENPPLASRHVRGRSGLIQSPTTSPERWKKSRQLGTSEAVANALPTISTTTTWECIHSTPQASAYPRYNILLTISTWRCGDKPKQISLNNIIVAIYNIKQIIQIISSTPLHKQQYPRQRMHNNNECGDKQKIISFTPLHHSQVTISRVSVYHLAHSYCFKCSQHHCR